MTGGVYWWQMRPSLTVLSCHPTRILNSFNQTWNVFTPSPKSEVQPNNKWVGSIPKIRIGSNPTHWSRNQTHSSCLKSWCSRDALSVERISIAVASPRMHERVNVRVLATCQAVFGFGSWTRFSEETKGRSLCRTLWVEKKKASSTPAELGSQSSSA